MRSSLRTVITAAVLVWMFATSLAGAPPFVKITSPKSGSVAHPGESVPITIDATPGAFVGVLVAVCGWTILPSGPPYYCVFEIPASSDSSGVIRVEAIGVPPSGLAQTGREKDEVHDAIDLDIERSESPKRLIGQFWDFYYGEPAKPFHHVDEIRHLKITGIFDDGSNHSVPVMLKWSKLTTYESSDPFVATVSTDGVVKAVGVGSAKITVRNGNATVVIPVTVPESEHGDTSSDPR